MKQLFITLAFLAHLSYSQKYVGVNTIFNNNRINVGIKYQTKKGLGFNINGGILCKDEFSASRGNLYERMFLKTNTYKFPFGNEIKSCYQATVLAFKVLIVGIKMQINYSLIFKTDKRAKNFFSVDLNVGVFLGSGYWQPTEYNNNALKDSLPCLYQKIKSKIGGLYGGIDINYFFSLKKYNNLFFGIGILNPFYKPLFPYNYAFDNESTNILVGLEPELKLSLIKKL